MAQKIFGIQVLFGYILEDVDKRLFWLFLLNIVRGGVIVWFGKILSKRIVKIGKVSKDR